MAVTVVNTLNSLEENITFQKTPVSNKFYASKLLNYVESVEIEGKKKTVFYTELNTNFNVGDRVFIVNGNYDSGDFISRNKYSKFTDGYRVLGCDGCRLILDYDYDGTLPYIEDNVNKSIKIYHVKTQRDFDYINSIVNGTRFFTFNHLGTTVTPFPTDTRISKFSGKTIGSGANRRAYLFSDSIIYISFTPQSSSFELNRNSASNILGAGFYYRDDTASTPTWIRMTGEISQNKFEVVNPQYSDVEKTLYINGEDFTLNGIEFKQRNTYRRIDSFWKLDTKYKIPYISKLNFRFGTFKGKHQDGIFGTNIRRNNWNSATWTSGVFLNSIWNSGSMESKSSAGEKSYYAAYSKNLISPVQTLDFSNNRGFGYNIIEDSNFSSAEIKNGNFENSNLISSATYSALDIYFGLTYSFGLKLSGSYKRCDIGNMISSNARFSNSNLFNSNINDSQIVNSQLYYSTAKSSTFTDEEGINIITADLWSYKSTVSFRRTPVRGILKLYISDEDYNKLGVGDAFYLTKTNKSIFVSSLNGDQKIKLPIESKFIFDIYIDAELDDKQIVVTLKNKNDNKIKTNAVYNGGVLYSTSFDSNTNKYASIDIDCSLFGFFYNVTSSSLSSSITGNGLLTVPGYLLSPIDQGSISQFFKGTYVRNADFKDGYFDKSAWKSGANINQHHHKIPYNGINLDIIYFGIDTLRVNLLRNELNSNIDLLGEDIFKNDMVWLNSIDEISGTVKSIAGRYRVIDVRKRPNFKEVYLRSLDGLTFSSTATYISSQAPTANYISIHKFRINDSQINSGLLSRTSLTTNTIYNSEFNNQDKVLDIQNIERLRLINILFKDNKNDLKSGYVSRSHFINDVWSNGVSYNSIWNGGTFSNGVFNTGYWQDGTFKNGSFINSDDTGVSVQNYDVSPDLYQTWLSGTFDNGEFFSSTWMNGIFNNGRFHNSEWYGGVWNNGILGNINLRYLDTRFGFREALPQSATNSIWNDGVVENATVGGDGIVYWYGGKFNEGEFTSNAAIPTKESIWYNGTFNSGRFSGLAKWKNGTFLRGKFHSYLGNTYSSPINPSTYSLHYAWENGKFLGGEFGNADLFTNSVWYDGEFGGGVFQGRFWYKGLLTKGEFVGSGKTGTTQSIFNSNLSQEIDNVYASSFTSSYYGLWYSGNVSDNRKTIKTEERVFSEIVRKIEERPIESSVLLKNMLWINGTFSHKSGVLQSSVWLNGFFYDGTLDSSIFNGYVDRTFSGVTDYSFASTQSCVWFNGTFDSTVGTGSFWISDWNRGTFNNGYMSGATWRTGVWNYGFADNILWLSGLWRNGNWNGAPFSIESIDTLVNTVKDERSKEIILNVGQNLGNNSTIYLNNVFSASTPAVITSASILGINEFDFDPNEQYSYEIPTRPGSIWTNNPTLVSTIIPDLDTARWGYFSSYDTYLNGSVVNLLTTHVATPIGTEGERPPGVRLTPESSRLYPKSDITSTTEVFALLNKTYQIFLEIAVSEYERVDVFIKVGDRDILKLTLASLAINVNGVISYYPNQYRLNFVYTRTTNTNPESGQFYIKKGLGGRLRVLKLNIVQRDYEYHPVYNNATYSNAINFTTEQISLPTDPPLSFEAFTTECNNVEVNFGNGLFRSGIWENGVWNNGYRSNLFVEEEDYYKFSDIVGINGIVPYQGKGTYQIDSLTWTVTLQSIETLQGLNVGDKVSIGNLVAIDINESRKLIKDYFTVKQVDLVNNTIVVELVSNFPIIRVEKDSPSHLIYVSKNIWMSGAFLNGLFRGIWSNGLYKSYPQIGVMADSHWIDGKFDGGRFTSRQYKIPGAGVYNSGLIQKFTFLDNSVFLPQKKYLSWIDVNFSNTQKSTIYKDSLELINEEFPNPQNFVNVPTTTFSYFSEQRTDIFGFITTDVLQSTSYFYDSTGQSAIHSLGLKYTVYQNLIPNEGEFTEPLSSVDFGVNLENFTADGWTFSDYGGSLVNSSDYPNNLPSVSETLKFSPLIIQSNVNQQTANNLRIYSTHSGIIQYSDSSGTVQTRVNKIILNNESIETIRNRYYAISLDLATFSFQTATWSAGIVTAESGIYILSDVDETKNPSLVKRQFFYNRRNLNLEIEAQATVFNNSILSAQIIPPASALVPTRSNQMNVIFNNISFVEVDMIPFFNYFGTASGIDLRIKKPWQAIAPFIDYTDVNFNFLNNVNITIDSDVIGNQVNYTSLGVGVSGVILGGGFRDVSFDAQTSNSNIVQ